MTTVSWPSSVWMHSPVVVRQTRIVLSAEPDATSAESCEKATDVTTVSWPSSVWMHSPVAVR